MTETRETAASRHERVKQILDSAHYGSAAEYQGLGPFWRLPLESFLTVVIYGVRMIAEARGCAPAPPPAPPVKSGSCCGGGAGGDPGGVGGASASGASPQAGRGAASGLIKGLRGQHPFDGTVFPRMPWGGGTYVPDVDIRFIEGWIDDGCPASDAPDAGSSVESRALSQGATLHPLARQPVNALRDESGGVKVRKNIEALSPEELRRYRCAIATMKSRDDPAPSSSRENTRDDRSFAYWARIHASNCQHGWEEFLPWHRFYLYYFEQQLQDIDPTVTIPYWDWAGSYAANDGVDTNDGGTIPEAFRCFVDDGVIRALTGVISDVALAALEALNKPGLTFNSGPLLFKAANLPYDASGTTDAILAALGVANPLWHRFRWPGGDSNILFEDYPSPDDIQNILGLDAFFSFGSGPDDNHFFGALENVHNLMHNFSGGNNPNAATIPAEPGVGDMVDAGVTAFDPIFWSHHSNVDRLWAEWQGRHPGQDPDDPTSPLAPWPGNVGDTLRVHEMGYEYALSTHTFSTDAGAAMIRVRTARSEVPARVLAVHRRAELRLTGVPHLPKGGVLRIFLNEPSADAHTPTRGNPHFVGQAHLFAGHCIGAPGHCEVPPETTRKFDARPRHRKTPHNLRFDVTEIIAKLRAEGETDFDIQIVALDTRGQPSAEVLRLSGVSLMFFD